QGMSGSDQILTDPAKMLDTLDADAISERLAELDRQSRALRVLLRAARARQRNYHQTKKEANRA
ncbi:MAG TPA: hypothetical protein VG125_09095, partial [Pirellulales bacterium]|nr:hypothetical protein [Pirellulales bacterium]